MSSLYRKYRPVKLEQVRGQDAVVKILKAHLANDSLPHTILFDGPTGTGKTTLARIIADKLTGKPGKADEINCADARSIELVRDIQEEMRYSPMGQKMRCYILDEVMRLPDMTQTAFLKSTEEPPKHTQFIFCASTVEKLTPAFLGRCARMTLKLLTPTTIGKILTEVSGHEKFDLGPRVKNEIVLAASGNGRKALTILQDVMTGETTKEQLRIIGVARDKKKEVYDFLAKALLKPAPWSEVKKILLRLQKDNLEGLRQQMLAYAEKVLIYNTNTRTQAMSYLLIRLFEDPIYTRAAFVAACWKCCQEKGG